MGFDQTGVGKMFQKRLEIGKERMLDGSFKKFRAWICSNLVEKRSERPVVVYLSTLPSGFSSRDR
jgi:hypothetical protein